MKIFVQTLSGKTFAIDDTKLDDIVWSVKLKIAEQKGIPAVQQRLIFQGKVLEDDLTLSESSKFIEDGSTLQLVPRLNTTQLSPTIIIVRTVTGNTIKVEVGSLEDTSIQRIKAQIEHQEGIPACRQRLIFDGGELQDDYRTLQDYDFETLGDELFLVLRPEDSDRPYEHREMLIKIKEGKSLSLLVNGNDTIQTIKNKISIAEGIPIDDQHIKFESWVLENNQNTLHDYGIPADSTLCLTSWKSILEEVKRDGLALVDMDVFVRDNKDIVLVAVEQNGETLKYASTALRRDPEVVLRAVRQDPTALLYALYPTEDLLFDVVAQNGCALAFAPDWAKRNKGIVLTAVGQNGLALEYASDSMRLDKDIVFAAIAADGRALMSTNLRHDRDTVLEVVRRNSSALMSVPRLLRSDQEIMKAAGQFQRFQKREAMAAERSKEVVWERIVAESSKRLRDTYGISNIRNEKEMAIEIIKRDPQAFKYAPRSLRADKEVVLAAVARNPELLKFALGGLNQDRDCWVAAGLWTKQQKQGKVAAEESTVRQIALSTKFSLDEKSNSSVTRFTRLLNEHPFFRGGKFAIYSPNAFSKDTCDPEWTRMTWPCRGTFETCQKKDAALKTGTPEASSCWRYSFRWHLEKAAKTNGFMLQVVDFAGNPGLFEKSL